MTILNLPGLLATCLYAPQLDGIQFWITERTMDGHRYATLLIEEETQQDASAAVWREPTFFLSKEQATALMNDLWHTGIRPSGIGDQGQTVSAVKAHLEDMRKIAFDFLNVRENPLEE